jgi:hypothetical protein
MKDPYKDWNPFDHAFGVTPEEAEAIERYARWLDEHHGPILAEERARQRAQQQGKPTQRLPR